MKICVFGASSNLIDPIYLEAGDQLGRKMGEAGHSLIFGGGATGMMGAVVRGIDAAGGKSIGVAPRFFDKPGILYQNCSEFVFTETMAERKAYMEENADAFIVTAGGIGTFEEFFEVYTLVQLGQMQKPIILLNTAGYYDEMMQLLQKTVEKGFLPEENLSLIHACGEPEEAVALLSKS